MSNSLIANSSQHSKLAQLDFVKIVGEVQNLLIHCGLKVLGSDCGWRLFNGLEYEQQALAYDEALTIKEIYRGVIAQGDSLTNSAAVISRGLAHHNLKSLAETSELISPSDVVEVYSPDSSLLFSNVQFLEYYELSLEQLFCANLISSEQISRLSSKGKKKSRNFRQGLKYLAPLWDRMTKLKSGYIMVRDSSERTIKKPTRNLVNALKNACHLDAEDNSVFIEVLN